MKCTEGGSLLRLPRSERQRARRHGSAVRGSKEGEKMQTVRVCLQKKKTPESKSDLVCGFGAGPVGIIFIPKVEVSGLSDHNKHGRPGFRALVKMTPGSFGRWVEARDAFPCFARRRRSSSPPTPAAADVGHHGEFVQSHSVGGED